MDREQKRSVAEALILGTPEPISAGQLASLIPRCTPKVAKELVDELNEQYVEQQRAFEIWEVAGGYQLRTLPAYAAYLRQSQPARAVRMSQAALETLAIVAYRQPVTRAEVEQIRGVDAGPVVRSLLERDLVKIAGHREVAGRPMLYSTTRRFLEVFGLKQLEDLPTLRDIEELAPASALSGDESAASESDAPDAAVVLDDGAVLAPDSGEDGAALEAEADAESVEPDAETTADAATAALLEAEPTGKPH